MKSLHIIIIIIIIQQGRALAMYTGVAWPLQTLDSLVRFGQMWSNVVRCGN